jgi:hypothetical protein
MTAAGEMAFGKAASGEQLEWRRLGRRLCMATAGEMAIGKAAGGEAAKMEVAGKAPARKSTTRKAAIIILLLYFKLILNL